jgi:hypothetical protein
MSFKNKILLVIKALLWDGSKKLPSIPAPQRAGCRTKRKQIFNIRQGDMIHGQKREKTH